MMWPSELTHGPVWAELAEALAHSLWQGTLLAFAAWLLGRTVRRSAPAFRHTLYMCTLLAVLMCLVGTYAVRTRTSHVTAGLEKNVLAPLVPGGAEERARRKIGAVASQGSLADSAATTSPGELLHERGARDFPDVASIVGILYVAGICMMAFRMCIGLWKACGIRDLSACQIPPRIGHACARLARSLQLAAAPVVGFSKHVAVPTVVGVWKPGILLPLYVCGMDQSQLELLLIHELIHIRRLDHVAHFLQRCAEVLLFYHPAVWFLSRRIHAAREECCDDLVVKHGTPPLPYALSLLDVAEHAVALRHTMSAAGVRATGRASRLKYRVERILQEPRSFREYRVRLWGVPLAVLAIVVVLVASYAVAREVQPRPDGIVLNKLEGGEVRVVVQLGELPCEIRARGVTILKNSVRMELLGPLEAVCPTDNGATTAYITAPSGHVALGDRSARTAVGITFQAGIVGGALAPVVLAVGERLRVQARSISYDGDVDKFEVRGGGTEPFRALLHGRNVQLEGGVLSWDRSKRTLELTPLREGQQQVLRTGECEIRARQIHYMADRLLVKSTGEVVAKYQPQSLGHTAAHDVWVFSTDQLEMQFSRNPDDGVKLRAPDEVCLQNSVLGCRVKGTGLFVDTVARRLELGSDRHPGERQVMTYDCFNAWIGAGTVHVRPVAIGTQTGSPQRYVVAFAQGVTFGARVRARGEDRFPEQFEGTAEKLAVTIDAGSPRRTTAVMSVEASGKVKIRADKRGYRARAEHVTFRMREQEVILRGSKENAAEMRSPIGKDRGDEIHLRMRDDGSLQVTATRRIHGAEQ